MKSKFRFFIVIILFLLLINNLGCTLTEISESNEDIYIIAARQSKIPKDILKREPATDKYPPILHSDEFKYPIPMQKPINTAGAEDSPFIMPDGNTLYFFFTPDVRVLPEKQVLDGVSGIWVSYKTNDIWSEPQRVWLQTPDKLALDGV